MSQSPYLATAQRKRCSGSSVTDSERHVGAVAGAEDRQAVAVDPVQRAQVVGGGEAVLGVARRPTRRGWPARSRGRSRWSRGSSAPATRSPWRRSTGRGRPSRRRRRRSGRRAGTRRPAPGPSGVAGAAGSAGISSPSKERKPTSSRRAWRARLTARGAGRVAAGALGGQAQLGRGGVVLVGGDAARRRPSSAARRRRRPAATTVASPVVGVDASRGRTGCGARARRRAGRRPGATRARRGRRPRR